MAKQAGLIAAVEPVLTELMQTDFRISERVLTAVLTKAGERQNRL
jgi:predicted nucleic acid-binding protein